MSRTEALNLHTIKLAIDFDWRTTSAEDLVEADVGYKSLFDKLFCGHFSAMWGHWYHVLDFGGCLFAWGFKAMIIFSLHAHFLPCNQWSSESPKVIHLLSIWTIGRQLWVIVSYTVEKSVARSSGYIIALNTVGSHLMVPLTWQKDKFWNNWINKSNSNFIR